MTREEFDRLLRAGHGRAALVAASSCPAKHADQILHACVRDLSTSEFDDRADYLAGVLDRRPDRDELLHKVWAAARRCRHEESLVQMMALAAIYASRGDANARRLLLQMGNKMLQRGNEQICESLFKGLGEEGMHLFLKAVDDGVYPGDESSFFWSFSQARDEEGRAVAALRSASAWSPTARALLQSFGTGCACCGRKDLEVLTYDQLRSLLRSRDFGWAVIAFTDKAPDEEILKAAMHMEKEPQLVRSYLMSIFSRRPYPLGPEFLLRMVEEEGLGWSAYHALGSISHPKVRSLALKSLERQETAVEGVTLLPANFQRGDCGRLLRISKKLKKLPRQRGFWQSIEIMLRRNPNIPHLSFCKAGYEQAPDPESRWFLVQLLHQRSGLPNRYREECKYDASEDTRVLVSES